MTVGLAGVRGALNCRLARLDANLGNVRHWRSAEVRMLVEIIKALFTISDGDAPPLGKVVMFGMFLAMMLILAVAMGRI